jgi:hypothetical protein
MFEFIFNRKDKKVKKFTKIIQELYDIQYIYCENCIRQFNKPCKMMYYEDNIKCFKCQNCNNSIKLNLIRDEDFIFDNEELKQYILIDDYKNKIRSLLILWKQPKNIVSNNDIINQILLDIKGNNFHTLFQYDPHYIQV